MCEFWWRRSNANFGGAPPTSPDTSQDSQTMLQDVWMAETRKDADAAFDAFVVDLCHQIREGRRVPEEGPRAAARLLRLSGRTLEPLAHLQTLSKAPSPPCGNGTIRPKGCLSNRNARHGVQLVEGAKKSLASPRQRSLKVFRVKCEVSAKLDHVLTQTAGESSNWKSLFPV